MRSRSLRTLVAPLLGLALAGLSLPGCYTAGVGSPAPRLGEEIQDTGISWLWGLVPAVRYAAECDHGLARATSSLTWYAYIVSPLTFGIVTPISRQYYCAQEP